MRLAILGLALLAAVPARAAVIFTDSFESPAVGPGGATSEAPANWQFIDRGGFTGVYDQGSTGRFSYTPDGNQIGYIGYGGNNAQGGGVLIRDSGTTVQAGTTYTFQAFVGADDASTNEGLWQLELWSGRPLDSGSALLGLVNANSPNANRPQLRAWAQNSVSYTASASAGQLWVALNNLAPAGVQSSTAFNDAVYDAVTLSSTQASSQPVPAPGGVALFALGLAAVGAARVRFGRVA